MSHFKTLKRRGFALFLAIVMVVSLLPISAFATLEEDFQMGYVNASSIDELNAILALCANEESGKTISITFLDDIVGNVIIPEGAAIQMNLNGRTLTGVPKADSASNGVNTTLTNYGTLSITDTSGNGAITRACDGYVIDNQGDLTVSAGRIYNEVGQSSAVRNAGAGKAATLTIESGAVIEHDCFIAVKNDDEGILTMTGGQVISNCPVVDGRVYPAIQNWGEAAISGGQVTGVVAVMTATWSDKFSSKTLIANGANVCGRVNVDTAGSPSVMPDVYVTGGTFTSYVKDAAPFSSTDTVEGQHIFVSGGTYEQEVTREFLAEGYAYVNGSVVVKTEADENDVAEVNGKFFTTLQSAVAAANPGETVRVLKDVEESITVGKTVTLNIPEGVTVSNAPAAPDHTITVTADGNLTVIGNGTVDNVSHEKAAIFNDGGTAILRGGTFTRSREAGTSVLQEDGTWVNSANGNSYYTVLNRGEMEIYDGVTVSQKGSFSSLIDSGWVKPAEAPAGAKASLTIYGGTFDGGKISLKNDTYCTMTVNGGTFVNASNWSVTNYGDMTINGGTFTCARSGLFNGVYQTAGNLTVTGGTFQYEIDGFSAAEGSTTAVSGGTFSTDVTEYCVPGMKWDSETHGIVLDEAAGVFAAAIGGKGYMTLSEAVKAAEPDDVIRVLKDIPDSGLVIITKPLTIDLNGYTVGGGDANATIMLNSKTANVEIKNGTISDTNAARGAVYVQLGEVTLTNVKVNASLRGVGIGPGVSGYYGKATLNAGTAITATESGVGVFGPNDGVTPKSELVVNEGVSITSQLYGIAGNGSNDDTVITINGGTVTATGGYSAAPDYSAGIYHPQQGTLTVNDGATISGLVGIQMAGGTAVINGGTVVSTDTTVRTDPFKAAQQGDGMVLDGAALSLVSRSAYGDIDVTVNGGTFLSQAGNQAVRKYGLKKTDTAWEVIAEPTKSTLAIKNGAYSTDVTEYCISGKAAILNETDGLWHIGIDVSKSVRIDETYYDGLDKAAGVAADTDTIVVVKDTGIASAVTVPGGLDLGSCTLDLTANAGLTLSGALSGTGKIRFTGTGNSVTANSDVSAFLTFNAADFPVGTKIEVTETNGTFTYKLATPVAQVGSAYFSTLQAAIDASNGAEVTLLVDHTENVTVADGSTVVLDLGGKTLTAQGDVVTSHGELTVKNGTIRATGKDRAAVYADAGTVTVADGTVLTGGYGVYSKGADLTIAAGSVEGQTAVYLKDATAAISGTAVLRSTRTYAISLGNNADMTISGGTFTGNFLKSWLNDATPGMVSVSGGTFNNAAVFDEVPAENISVTGGRFRHNVTDVAAEGYLPVGPDNGWYSVVEGTLAISRTTATLYSDSAAGNTVTLTVTPANAAGLTWSSDDKTVATVNAAGVVTAVANGTATVTAAISNGDTVSCVVTVTNAPVPVGPPSNTTITDEDVPLASVLPFDDVAEGQWFHDAVQYVYDNKLMSGITDNLFDPQGNTTRGMIVTILYRLEGEPAVTGTSVFDDVADGQWYTNAVIWGTSNEVVAGFGDGTFRPTDNITREQLAAILYRYAALKGYDVTVDDDASLNFPDAEHTSAYAQPALLWCVEKGLINGMDDGTIGAVSGATRAQAAAILKGFCENFVDAE